MHMGPGMVMGAGDGQSDHIPAKLSDGEYVMDASTVSALGNGSNDAGARVLDKFRQNVRSAAGWRDSSTIQPKVNAKKIFRRMAGGRV
jgi:hypothetical protein